MLKISIHKLGNVNPDMLAWSRINRGLSVKEAVKLLNAQNTDYRFTIRDLHNIEQGRQGVVHTLLEDFAIIYQRHLAVFFHEKLPQELRTEPEIVTIHQENGREKSRIAIG